MTRTRKVLLLAIVCCSALTATASRSVAADSVL
jgi:hypothetical protein